jgi:serine/threonine-protein kinase
VRTFGKYRLVEPLASGGMADVWRAEVTGAAGVVKEVALKLVRGEHGARSDFIRMFVDEARLASRLGHANVVQVFEFDEVQGRHYIAMELVRGRDLGRVVERARERGLRLGLPRTVQIGVEVARGLSYAHRLAEGGQPLGLVHRDVSPHNILVSFEGEVKLTDFGIARAMHRAGLTEPGTIKGKAAYMAPEQARGEAVDARADVFSLGVVLWELCAGRRLFARESDVATLEAVRSGAPPSPPSAWNEDVPPALDRAILGALEHDPARRTASAQELGAALAAVLLEITRAPADADLRELMHRLFAGEIAAQQVPPEPTRVRPPVAAAEPVAGFAPEPAPAPEDAPTRTVAAPRRARRLALVAGAAVLAGAGVAAVPLVRSAGVTARVAPPTATSTATAITATPTATPPPTATPTPTPTGPAAARARLAGGAPVPDALPEASGEPEPDANAGVAPLEAAPGLSALAVPAPASGQGILSVNATPWGLVRVNGHEVGDTPQSMRLPAGRHRVHIERKGHRAVDELVTVKAGKRTKILR